MSTFLIVSDNHRRYDGLEQILSRHQDIDHYIHCGDSELPFLSDVMQSFIKVRGNCDFDTAYPLEVVETLEGISFFITHGHEYNVKMNLINLGYRTQELGATIACFGHSHIATVEYSNGILLINPGSISQPRMRQEKTYAICSIKESIADVSFYDEEGIVVKGIGGTYQIG